MAEGEGRGAATAGLAVAGIGAAALAYWYFVARKVCPEGQVFDEVTGKCIPDPGGGGGGGGGGSGGLTVRSMLTSGGVGETFNTDQDMVLRQASFRVVLTNTTSTPVRVSYMGLANNVDILGERVFQPGERVTESGIKRVVNARIDLSPSARGPLPVACEGVDFGGECVILGEGEFPNLASFQGRDWEDRISSVYLPPVAPDGSRYEVALYEGPYFSGSPQFFIVSDQNLQLITFSDRASSMKVRKVFPAKTCASQGATCTSPSNCVGNNGRCIDGTGCSMQQCCCDFRPPASGLSVNGLYLQAPYAPIMPTPARQVPYTYL